MPARDRRPAVTLDPALHRALRKRAEVTAQPVSALVDEAVRVLLAEDAEDAAALAASADEPTISLEEFVRDLKERGAL